MFEKVKPMLAGFLSVVTVALSLPLSSFYTLAEADETADHFQIIREDPTLLDWNGEQTAYIDFSEITEISVTENTAGHGLTLMANYGAGSWKAANRLSEDGFLLLGKEANTNGGDPEVFDTGNAYFKLDIAKNEKAKTAYAVKIDYYGGGEKVDGGSYIDISYNSLNGTAKGRNTYGATYNSEKIETMYYVFPEANLSEGIGSCGADIRLETWNQAQLKIRRVSLISYEPLEIPKMKTLVKASDEETEPVASIDFSALNDIPLSGTVAGNGLSLITSQSTGNTRASNVVDNGFLLLGANARKNDNPSDMAAKPTVTGAIYIKLDAALSDKANTPYAVKIDYYGGGIKVDSGSYIDLRYNNKSANANASQRKTYGATYNSGEVQSMYFSLSDANFAESIRDSSCGADFRLETWNQAQLKIKKISVVKYNAQKPPADLYTLFSNAEADDVPEDTVFINPNIGENYGLTYDSGTTIVKIIDKAGAEHYAAQSVDYLNFKISDADVKAADKVTLSISYWDIGTKSFSIQYNAEIPDPLPPNTAESYYNYYSTSAFDMYDSKELVTLDIPIENAAFSGKQNGGCDFRLRTMYIPDFYIESIAIKIGIVDVTEFDPVAFPEMTDKNNFKDRSIVGYQAWFQASDSMTGGWNHWNSGAAPSGGTQTFDVYPDVSDYPDKIMHQTGYANLLNGNPSILYDGTTEEAIDVQVKWMQDYGIDGFAVSRFYAGTSAVEIKVRNKLDYMKEAAERYDRLFYMGYDMSGIGGNGMAGIKRLESDFVLNVEKKYVTSPNYAQIDGKPVVSLWGFQGSEFNRYPNTECALSLINWFHERGYYVIGGCPDNNWANDKSDYAEVYRQIDMITPWTVGRYGMGNCEGYLEDKYKQDREYLDAFNAENPDTPKSYMPTIFPGFSWANWATGPQNGIARYAGEFMWLQARLAAKYGFTSSFIAMFDEYDEGTSIAKMAQDSMDIPSDQYFVTAAVDGKWLSSDFYLRATNAVSRLLRGEIEDSETIPISHAVGPVYWRNSFERRFINYKTTSGQAVTALANIDVCIPDGEILEYVGIDDMNFFDIAEDPYADGYSYTGEYALNINGTALPKDGKSCFSYKIANTDIAVVDDLALTYKLRAENELGGHVYIDLVFDDGRKLSEINGKDAAKAERGAVGEWTSVTFDIPSSLKGRKITSVIATYDYAYPGEFNAYIDDVVIAKQSYDASLLSNLIKDAQLLISGNRANYFTAATVNGLIQAIQAAKAVSGDNADGIKAAYTLLIKAVNALVAVPRKVPAVVTVTPVEQPIIEDIPLVNEVTPVTDNMAAEIKPVPENTETPEAVRVKKVIKKIVKSGNGNQMRNLFIIVTAVVVLGLLAMMVVASARRKKTNQ